MQSKPGAVTGIGMILMYSEITTEKVVNYKRIHVKNGTKNLSLKKNFVCFCKAKLNVFESADKRENLEKHMYLALKT